MNPATREARPILALGLMSGTSLDGIDAALMLTDGEYGVERVGALTVPYTLVFRDRLRSCLGGDGPVVEVEAELTRLHGDAVVALLDHLGVAPADVAVVGFHGHTILHAPERGRTWQIGDGAALAAMTGIDVVADFRSADVASGGQGAPLAPAYHRALVGPVGDPVAVLNLGGIANLTWIGPDARLVAFDTGPANGPIDDWVRRHGLGECDDGGRLAAAGRADERVIDAVLAHPWFRSPPPKSLDRLDFALDAMPDLAGLSAADGAATLARLAAAGVVAALDHLPAAPVRWLVAGGGRHNAALMAELKAGLGVPVEPVEVIGADGDSVEAEAFALLAVHSLDGRPSSFPGTTGVPEPMTGGVLHRAPAGGDRSAKRQAGCTSSRRLSR